MFFFLQSPSLDKLNTFRVFMTTEGYQRFSFMFERGG